MHNMDRSRREPVTKIPTLRQLPFKLLLCIPAEFDNYGLQIDIAAKIADAFDAIETEKLKSVSLPFLKGNQFY